MPCTNVYYSAAIMFTSTDGKAFRISLSGFTFLSALIGLLDKLGLTYLDPLKLENHQDDLEDYLKTLFNH